MPSTFTNNGGIELPADGEKDGVWGDVVNLNMQIVDRLTNGVGAVPLTGITHTLTTANGVLSDGQYGLIVFGGSPSGTNTVTIVPNDAEKVYFVRNATAQSVIMTQGSGSTVTIPAGAGAIVYANGTGTGAAVADLTATFVPDLTLAGVDASAAELNILDGATLSTAELNILDGATLSTAELNILDGATLSTAELNILDGATVSTTEINHLVGVTSDIQAQIDSKQATITGAATTIVAADLAVSRAVVSDGSGKVAVSAATATELGYLSGATSAIQTQLDGKQATVPTQLQATWNTGTDTTESLISADKLATTILAQTGLLATSGPISGNPSTVSFFFDPDGYSSIRINLAGIQSSVVANLHMRISLDGTTYSSSALYAYSAMAVREGNATVYGSGASSQTSILLTPTYGVSATAGTNAINGNINFNSPYINLAQSCVWQIGFITNTGTDKMATISGAAKYESFNSQGLLGVEFFWSTGTFSGTTGRIEVTGDKV